MFSCFLSYAYNDEQSEWLASMIARLLETIEVKTVDGKDLDLTEGLNGQIRERIDGSQALIAVRINGAHSDYVSQELGYASGRKIPTIIVADSDSAVHGILSEQYFLKLDKAGLNLATELIATINRLKTSRAMSIQPTFSQHSGEDEIDSEGWVQAVRENLRELRDVLSEQKFTSALQIASHLIDAHPDCWRAYIAKSAALVHLFRHDDADQVLDAMIEKFSANRRALSYAYQNKGWLSQRRAIEFTEAGGRHRVDMYRRSLACEPRVVVYVNLIQNLLKLGHVDQAEEELASCLRSFPAARTEFLRQVEVQGADFVEEITRSRLLSSILFPQQGNGGATK